MADNKEIADVAYAPVVSVDSTSKEAILARNAKEIEAQAKVDGKFDTTLERFRGTQTTLLGGISVAMFLLLVSAVFQKRR